MGQLEGSAWGWGRVLDFVRVDPGTNEALLNPGGSQSCGYGVELYLGGYALEVRGVAEKDAPKALWARGLGSDGVRDMSTLFAAAMPSLRAGGHVF